MRLDRGFIWVSEGESIKQIFGEKTHEIWYLLLLAEGVLQKYHIKYLIVVFSEAQN